jgi:Fe-S-cluster containining protein
MNDESNKTTLSEDFADSLNAPESLREDLNSGLCHLHFLSMQSKHDLVDITSRFFALMEELVANGQIDLRTYDERRLRLREKEETRLQQRAHVQVADPVDKYKLEDLPQIDCQSRIHLCKARCCKLTFPLSFQDLDERIVQWNYSNPYQIRQKPDGYCVHNNSGSGHCCVYENRPAICRTYDCRNDKRIWLDFDKGISAPEEETQQVQSNTSE